MRKSKRKYEPGWGWGWVRVRVRVREVALVLEVEALGQVEVALDGRALPPAADGVGDLDVDLRPVEGAAALVHLVVPPLALERLDQPRRRLLPDLIRADRLVGPGGEVDLVPG